MLVTAIMDNISFCITTYNRAKLLNEAVVSIINEFGKSVEIVIVDGGSEDNTGDVINAIKAQGANIIYDISDDLDVCDGIVRAIKLSSRNYCWLFSDDDQLEKGCKTHIESYLSSGEHIPGVSTGYQAYDKDLIKPVATVPASESAESAEYKVLHTVDEAAEVLGLHMGFISCQILNRQYCTEIINMLNLEKLIREWIVVYLICGVIVKYGRWDYLNSKCVRYRSDNDSFVGKIGVLNRIELTFVKFPVVIQAYSNVSTATKLQSYLIETRLLRTLSNLKSKGIAYDVQFDIYRLLRNQCGLKFRKKLSVLLLILIPNAVLTITKYVYLRTRK